MVPPLWRRLTAPLIARWDAEMANEDERRLVAGEGAARHAANLLPSGNRGRANHTC